MSELRLHKRYRDKLIVTVTFVLMIVMVAVACSVACVKLYAEESSVADETQGESSSSEETTKESSTEMVVNKTGTVKTGTSKVRVRSSIDTSSTANVITTVDGGCKLEILDTVKVSDTYVWYKVSFYQKGVNITGYISGEYVVIDEDIDYSENMDFEEYLNSQNFPESYKDGLRELHKKYPKWVFVADHVSNDWNEMVKNQNVQGRSLIAKSSISSWKSTETTVNSDGSVESKYYNWDTSSWYPWDGGNWVQASEDLLKYTLDPRNFLNEKHIFMFEKLSFNSAIHNADGVNNIIRNSFMNGSNHSLSYDNKLFSYADAILYAGQVSKVSPYHLATRIIQEQGSSGTGRSISGTVKGYEGYYNYFNIGASAGSTGDPVVNGLVYAKSTAGTYLRPWNTRMKSILGGSIYLGEKYISVGQDTIYYEKYDLVGYWHQYMTHVLAPRSESEKSAQAYSEEMKQNTSLVFYIPVYKNMPAEVCEIPTKDGSPNNTLANLSVEGNTITPSFSKFVTNYDLIVENEVSTIKVVTSKADSTATVKGDGNTAIKVGDNRVEVVVTAQNGDVRTYTINVVRKEGDGEQPTQPPSGDEPSTEHPTEPPTVPPTVPPTEPPTETKPTNQYNFSAYVTDGTAGIISGFTVGDTATTILSKISTSEDVTKKVIKTDGSVNEGVIQTGDRVVLYKADGSELISYFVVIYGDANGDGAITSMDMLYAKRHILNTKSLVGAYAIAANANRGSDGVTSLDLVYMKRHVLGTKAIVQN